MIRESDGLGAHLMAQICAWCKTDMGAVVCEPAQAGQVSHGMCADCFNREIRLIPNLSDASSRRLGPRPRGVKRASALLRAPLPASAGTGFFLSSAPKGANPGERYEHVMAGPGASVTFNGGVVA